MMSPMTKCVGSRQGQRKVTVAQSTLSEDVCIEDRKLRRIPRGWRSAPFRPEGQEKGE